jgi:glycosyltransferase involved in cell wall biosynthesis
MMLMALGAVAGLAAAAWTLARPIRVGFVLAFVVATNASAVATGRFAGVPPLITPFAVVVLVVAGIRWMNSRERATDGRGYEALVRLALAAVVASAAIGAFHARSPVVSADAALGLLERMVLLLAVAAVCTSPDGIRGVLGGLVAAGAWLGGLTTWQLLFDVRTTDMFGFSEWSAQNIAGAGRTLRATGPFGGDPNAFSQYLVTMAAAAVMIAAGRRWPGTLRVAAGATATLLAVAVTATASRTGLVALGVVALVVVVLVRPSRRVLAAIGALVVVAALFGPVDVGSRLGTLGQVTDVSSTSQSVSDSSIRGRTSELIAAARMFVDHPVAGVGYGSYNDRYLEYSRVIGLDRRYEDRSAHSLPLEIAAEQGLVGVVAWGLLFGLALVGAGRLVRRDRDLGHPVLVALIGFSTTTLFLHDVHPGLLFAVLGIGVGAGVLAGRYPPPPARDDTVRVAMVIQNYLPSVGGAERQLASVTPLLRKRGITPIIVTRGRDGRPARDTIAGAEVIRVPTWGPKPMRSVMFVDGAVAAIRRLEVDAVIAYDSLTPSTIGRLVRDGDGISYATKILRSGPLGDLERLERKPFGRRRLRRLLDTSSRFVTISADIDEELALRGVAPDRRRFIPNGVDTDRFAPSAAARHEVREEFGLGDAPVVVMTGRLAPEKRVVEIADAWSIVRAACPDAQLLVVGDGPLEPMVQGIDGVRVLGRREDVERILAAADVYLSASVAEGLSNSLLEAMSTGLACVVTEVGGVRDLIEHDGQGCVVPVDDLERLVAEVVTLLGDPDRRESSGRASRRRVASAYGLAATADRLAELCVELAERRVSAPLEVVPA